MQIRCPHPVYGVERVPEGNRNRARRLAEARATSPSPRLRNKWTHLTAARESFGYSGDRDRPIGVAADCALASGVAAEVTIAVRPSEPASRRGKRRHQQNYTRSSGLLCASRRLYGHVAVRCRKLAIEPDARRDSPVHDEDYDPDDASGYSQGSRGIFRILAKSP